MNDIERELCGAVVYEVPATLDARVERAIRDARTGAGSPRGGRVPVWLAAAACLVFALAGFLVGSRQPSPHAGSRGSVMTMHASLGLARWLGAADRSGGAADLSGTGTTVETIFLAGEPADTSRPGSP